jgi:hypothetical protein
MKVMTKKKERNKIEDLILVSFGVLEYENGKYRDKIVVISNGINTEDFDIPYSKEQCRK